MCDPDVYEAGADVQTKSHARDLVLDTACMEEAESLNQALNFAYHPPKTLNRTCSYIPEPDDRVSYLVDRGHL